MTNQNHYLEESSINDNSIKDFEASWMNFTRESFQNIPKHAQKERTLAFEHFLQDVRVSTLEDKKMVVILAEIAHSTTYGLPVTGGSESVSKEFHIVNSIYISPAQLVRNINSGETSRGWSIDHYLAAEQNWENPVFKKEKTREQRIKNLIEDFSDAFTNSGAVIRISKNSVSKEPILCSLSKPAGGSSVNRVIIHCDEGSEATILLQINGQFENNLGGNITTLEVELASSAKLKLITMQNLSLKTNSLAFQTAYLEKDAYLDWTSIDIGGQYTHNEIKVLHVGEDCTSRLNGIFICGEGQEYISNSKQLHVAKGTQSRFLLKGIQLGNGRSTWKGNIFVSEGAEKTDSYQANRNLILSSNAQAVSIPGLEILSDDVKCSHGATISNLDEEQLFYLLSRGISNVDAIQLLALGYIEDVLKNLNDMQFFDELVNMIKKYLPMELIIPEASNARMI